MTQSIASIPVSLVVAPRGSVPSGVFTPPYALPAARTKVAIPVAGRNVANDVKPAAHTNGSWQYALFQTYGGGSFTPDYSPGGAYVLAGMGGHNGAPCFGAAIFDFANGRGAPHCVSTAAFIFIVSSCSSLVPIFANK